MRRATAEIGGFWPGQWETLYAHRGLGQPINDLYLRGWTWAALSLRLTLRCFIQLIVISLREPRSQRECQSRDVSGRG